MARPSEVELLGRRLRTDPQVFHPTYFSSSQILAEYVGALATSGMKLLDMGTGSGAIALSAAAAGATVTACDLNPRAVALARTNAQQNDLVVEVLESDLFAAVTARRFDVIAFNIPFYTSEPRTHYEAAFRAGARFEVVHRFAEGSPAHLSPGGRVVIVFSEDCGHDETIEVFTSRGFAVHEERQVERSFERFYVASFRARAG